MAELQDNEDAIKKSGESRPEATKNLTITLPGPDGLSQVDAVLELDEDATKHPRLAKIVKRSTSKTGSLISKIRETHVVLSVGSGHQKAAIFYEDCVGPLLAILHPNDHQNF